MASVAIALGVIFGVAFAILLAAAMLPVCLELRVEKRDGWIYAARVRPFGRLGPPIALRGRPNPEKPKRAKTRKKRAPGALDGANFANAILRLILDILDRVRLEEASLNARIGLGDPAETGMLYGQLMPILIGAGQFRNPNVNVTPDFDRAVLEGHGRLTLSLVPIALVAPGWRFLQAMRRAAP